MPDIFQQVVPELVVLALKDRLVFSLDQELLTDLCQRISGCIQALKGLARRRCN